jgi:hypothetical protein
MKNATYTNTLKSLMSSVNGATFISLDIVTPVKLTGGKKNPLQGRVTKKTTGSNVMVFQNKKGGNSYQNMINRRLEKEGKIPTFEVGPRAWGTRIEGTPFISHNDQTYLEVIFLHSGKSEYLVDGKEFDGEIEGLPVKTESEESQEGLSNKVIIRAVNCDNIQAVTINHVRVAQA